MTTLHAVVTEMGAGLETAGRKPAVERRSARRHDLEEANIAVERFDGRRASLGLGRLIDLSSGGMRLRTKQQGIRADQQIRVRIELPRYAGICPFVETAEGEARPKTEWTGWMAVTRVQRAGEGEYDVAGRLIGMDEMDRGMLGLYLSTQPLAA